MRSCKILIVGGGKIFKGIPGLVYKTYNIITIIVYIEVYKVLTGEAEDLWIKLLLILYKLKQSKNASLYLYI